MYFCACAMVTEIVALKVQGVYTKDVNYLMYYIHIYIT